MKRGEAGVLLSDERGDGLEEMELSGGEEFRVMEGNGMEEVVREESAVGALFAKQERVGATEGGMKFVGLAGEELAENGTCGYGGKEVPLGPRANLA